MRSRVTKGRSEAESVRGTTRQIRVVAPASSMADLPAPLRNLGVSRLRNLGFEVTFGRNVDQRSWHTGGRVQDRVDDIHAAVDDPDVGIVMAVYGGYNSNQLLPFLDFERIRTSGKVFAGYSDIDGLLLAIQKQGGNACLHGPGFAAFCDPGLLAYTEESFLKALRGGTFRFTASLSCADDVWYLKPGFGPREVKPCGGWRVLRHGESRGPILGGNLETLMALAGTSYFPDLNGKILFVEDTSGNNPGSFHQKLSQLSMQRGFEGIAGLVVGRMRSGSALANPDHLDFIIEDAVLRHREVPILTDVNCSHVDPMMTIPLGQPCVLHASDPPYLEITSEPLFAC